MEAMKDSSHVALYRKYRPETFADVVGQDAIVTALTSAIENKRVAHAYLFTGGRGIGKTSIARIFAHSLGVADEDIYEMDAASNRGIDDIRELREGVRALPFSSPYKVYILDEVHMLTKESWAALLKTLEEPPKHVIFILATTELQKVPDTIISRSQVHAFKLPSEIVLAKHVEAVAGKEKVKLDDGVARLVAMVGDQSFRDTLGALEKLVTSSSDKKITLPEAEAILGAPSQSLAEDMLRAIASGDIDAVLTITRTLEEEGKDMSLYWKRFLHLFRGALYARFSKSKKSLFDLSPEEENLCAELAATKSPHLSSSVLASLLEASMKTARAPISVLPLELALMDMLGDKE